MAPMPTLSAISITIFSLCSFPKVGNIEEEKKMDKQSEKGFNAPNDKALLEQLR